MTTRRKIDYPSNLDKIAEEFGVSIPELLNEIAHGELILVRPPVSDEELVADEPLWDKQFADSQDLLDQLAESIHSDYLAGLTEDFDPDLQ